VGRYATRDRYGASGKELLRKEDRRPAAGHSEVHELRVVGVMDMHADALRNLRTKELTQLGRGRGPMEATGDQDLEIRDPEARSLPMLEHGFGDGAHERSTGRIRNDQDRRRIGSKRGTHGGPAEQVTETG
jgi:hypothetical protein